MTTETAPVETPPSGATQAPTGAPATPPAAATATPPSGEAPKAPESVDKPLDGQTPPAGEKPPESDWKVPDEYKDKPWASKVKNMADVYKQLDNLDQLAGKKTIVPDLEKATDEEREAYFSQTRPKDASAYVFDEVVSPEAKEAVSKLMLDNGITAYQANNIIKGYREFENNLMAEQFNPDKFKETMKTAFGDDWEAVTGAAHNAVKGLMSPDDNKLMDALPNKYAALIYRTIGSVVKAYGIKETGGAHLGAGGKPAATDIETTRDVLREKISSMSSRMHSESEVQALIKELAATYDNDPRLKTG